MNDQIKAVRAAIDAAQKLRESESSLRTRHKDLSKERTEVEIAFRSLDEVIATANETIDAAATAWAKDKARGIVRSLSGYTEDRLPGDGEYVRRVAPGLPSPIRRGELDFRDLCGLLPELMKARITEVIRSSPVKFGLSAAARAAKIAELDREIASLETMHTQLVDAAAAVQITLPYLPAVQASRDQEARQNEIERERAAARAAGQGPIYSAR